MHERVGLTDFLDTYLYPFEGINNIYDEDKGFIVWRTGTGGNTELLHVRTFEGGKGYGRWLFYQMLDRLKENPPYYSVFGFTRVGNTEAQAFYGALGFKLQRVMGLYNDGEAVLFWQSFDVLWSAKESYESSHPVRGQT